MQQEINAAVQNEPSVSNVSTASAVMKGHTPRNLLQTIDFTVSF